MNKKAQYEFLRKLVIACLVGGTMLLGLYSLTNAATESSNLETCKNSVLARQQDILLYETFIKNIEVSRDRIPLLCDSVYIKEPISGTRDEIKQKISALAAQCWYKYAEGSVRNTFAVGENIRGCDICFSFKIDDVKEQPGSKFPDEIVSENSRPEDTITSAELENYFMSNRYNPPLVRGGSTKLEIGDSFKFEKVKHETISEKEIDLKSINSLPANKFIIDYTGLLKQDTKTKIDEIGLDLYRKGHANMLIIVGDEFKDIDRKAVRNLVNKLELDTSNTIKDSFVVVVDLENQLVRVHLGLNLESSIKEFEINPILKQAFNENENINDAILETVRKISSAIMTTNNNHQELLDRGINIRSYYAYFTLNEGYPIIDSDLETGELYTISYMSLGSRIDNDAENNDDKDVKKINNLLIADSITRSNYCLAYER